MKIVFISNYLNHHQKPISDEFYRLTAGNYWFVAVSPMSESRRRLGYTDMDEPYLRKCYGMVRPEGETLRLILEADAVIIGSAPYAFVAQRQKEGKLVLKYSERIYKQEPGIVRLFVHRLRFNYQFSRHTNTYLLCSSAFAAADYARIGCFEGRAYKWGYFTSVPDWNVEKNLEASQDVSRIRILWVARFLFLKHPEMPVKLAARLKQQGIDFEIDMYGIGPEMENTQRLIERLGVSDCVELLGSAANEKILEEMRRHQIFLFTSDRNEGWGAVVNEAMSNGCAIVASDAIGSVPYMVTDGENGMVYRDGDLDDLFRKVKMLIERPALRAEIARKAYRSMKETWSPANAAESLVRLIGRLSNGQDTDISNGPCSKA